MTGIGRIAAMLTLAAATVGAPIVASTASAATARQLERDGRAALQDLYASQPSAKLLGSKAKAILVFPAILKAGFMFGGQIGEGVRLQGNKATGFYNSVAASYGFQAGIQKYGYALFFMNDQALRQL